MFTFHFTYKVNNTLGSYWNTEIICCSEQFDKGIDYVLNYNFNEELVDWCNEWKNNENIREDILSKLENDSEFTGINIPFERVNGYIDFKRIPLIN